MPFQAKLTVWQFPRKSSATKSFHVGADGKLHKVSPAFRDGLGRVVMATLADIAKEHLNTAKIPKVLIYAVPRDEISLGEGFVIASEANATKAGYNATKLFKKLPPDTRVITRTKANFGRAYGEPGFMLIDVDGFPLPADDILEKLAQAWPELAAAPVLCTPSSSGFVCLEGDEPQPSGWHILVGIADASDTERALGVLFDRLWLVPGAHRIALAENGAPLEKAMVDLALRNAVQPHFFQAPELGAGIVRSAPQPQIRNPDAGGVDTRLTLPDLTIEEQGAVAEAKDAALTAAAPQIAAKQAEVVATRIAAELAANGGTSENAAEVVRKRMQSEFGGVLDPLTTTLHFDRFGWVTCDDLAADPARYDDETLADPVDPYYGGEKDRAGKGTKPGRNKAKCRLSPDRRAFHIYTFAHSQSAPIQYTLPMLGQDDFSSAFDGVDVEEAELSGLSLASILEIFSEVATPEAKFTDADVSGAFVSVNGVLEFDLGSAKTVRRNPDGRVLLEINGPASADDEGDEGAAIVAGLVRTGRKAKVVICGRGDGAVDEALRASEGADGIKSRVDFYGGPAPLKSHALIARADKCMKPKALEAVKKFAPRSLGAVLCAKSHTDKCKFFDECGFILNRLEAASADVVHGSAAMAGTELNALIGETAGPLALFMDPAATVSIKLIPASDFFKLGGVFKDIATACIANQSDTLAAIRSVPIDAAAMKSLEDLSRQHNIAAGPSDDQDAVVMAVRIADATKSTSLPSHEIAFAVMNAFAGKATISVHEAERTGYMLTFTVSQGLLRADHHRASVAVVDVPFELCRTDVIGMRLYDEPAIAVRGGRGIASPIIQVFDPRRNGRMNLRPLLVALQAAGLRPAVVGSNLMAEELIPGVSGLHPSDSIPEGTGMVIWADALTASDLNILRTAAVAGLSLPSKLKFRFGSGFWIAGGKRFAAAIERPEDDGACACWQAECWRDVENAMVNYGGAPIIVLSGVPPVFRAVEAIISAEDLIFSSVSEAVSFATAIADIDRLDAAEAACTALSGRYDAAEILDLALSEPQPLSAQKSELAAVIGKIWRKAA